MLLASLLALAGSLVVDALLVAASEAISPLTKGFAHFRFSDYGLLTTIGVIVACAAWPMVTRLSWAPRWLFFRLAIGVTLVLWLPDLWILVKGEPPRAVGVLAVMHLAIAIVTYNALVRIAPARSSPAVSARASEAGAVADRAAESASVADRAAESAPVASPTSEAGSVAAPTSEAGPVASPTSEAGPVAALVPEAEAAASALEVGVAASDARTARASVVGAAAGTGETLATSAVVRAGDRPDQVALRIRRSAWVAMTSIVCIELALGVAALVVVPFGRGDAWIPTHGKFAYLLHAIVGMLVGVGSIVLLIAAVKRSRLERVAALVGLLAIAAAAVGGGLVVSHATRLLGAGLMMLGGLVAAAAYLTPVIESMPTPQPRAGGRSFDRDVTDPFAAGASTPPRPGSPRAGSPWPGSPRPGSPRTDAEDQYP